ncbi:MAG: methyltransferase [Polyangiaceae bacterium]
MPVSRRPTSNRDRRKPNTNAQLASLSIDSLALGGDGVAHAEYRGERRAVFVPLVAPGDQIVAAVDWTKHPARGVVVSIDKPSVDRREPACSLTAQCGGCPWMHIAPSARRNEIVRLVQSSVLRGQTIEPTFHEAPSDLAYRSRARLALHGGRSFIVGYRAADGRHVTPIDACPVLSSPLAPVVAMLRECLAGATGDGEASVALGRDGLPVVAMSWSGELSAEAFARFDAHVRESRLAGVSIQLRDASVPAVIGDPTVVVLGADGLDLEVAPGGFAQANPHVASMLAEHVVRLAKTDGKIVELYAGSGFFTVALARGASAYTAVESDVAAVAMAKKNLASRGLSGAKVIASDAAKVAVPRGLDVVLVDPPRTGCEPAVIDALCNARARRVVYVSCDAATLARDVQRLTSSGYALQSVDVFDMMPGTAHVELVAVLDWNKRAAPAKSP